jgi:hypothetical protein
MMTFETEEEKRIQKKAIEVFVNTFGGTYQKLDASDVDYKIFDKNKNLIAYAEISGRVRTIRNAYPLPISAKKLVKLIDKRLAPVVIWSCEDGIIYGKADKLVGDIKFDGDEMMVYYDKQRSFKYIRFV